MADPKFDCGDLVLKCTGDYHLPGEVISNNGITSAGKRLLQVEHFGGFTHVYGDANLRELTIEDVGKFRSKMNRILDGYVDQLATGKHPTR